MSGSVSKLARYRNVGNGTRVTLDIKDPSDSFFLVFREKARLPSVIETEVPPATLDLSYDASGRLIAESQAPVDATLKMSDGTSRAVRIASAPEVLTIGGSWKTSSTDPQGFSVLHETTFDLPADFAKDRRVTLDLGNVAVMAKVTVNDITHDTLWRKPYRLDITRDLKPGTNRIQVLVTSTSEGKPSFGPTTLRAFHRVIVD